MDNGPILQPSLIDILVERDEVKEAPNDDGNERGNDRYDSDIDGIEFVHSDDEDA